MPYFLERLIGSSRNEQIPLIGNRMTIGRSVDSSIQILSPMVSRCHAILTYENNYWIIKDVKSINGVYVNETRLLTEGTCCLTDKDVISLGPPDRTEFRYCYCKYTTETDSSSYYEMPRKIRKIEKFQSTSDICPDKNVKSISFENASLCKSNLHIGAECTISNNRNKETALVNSKTLNDVKQTLPKEGGILNKNNGEDLEVGIKVVEASQLTSQKTDGMDLCQSSNEANSGNLKLEVESLGQSMEKEQEELQNKLLRAEAQLIESNYESRASTSDICPDKNVKNVSFENASHCESNCHIGAECTISNNSNKETALVNSKTLNDVKQTLPKAEGILNKNNGEDLEDGIKVVEASQLTSQKTDGMDLCQSSNEANSENLKLKVESLCQLLLSKEKEQEELQDKLLRAEAQLIESNYESRAKDNEVSIQEKIKSDLLKHVGDIMESELICGICTELFVEAVTLNCSHTYCKFCIQKWKHKKKICPICRASIKTETQALVLDNFIEKMVENLTTEMKEHRNKLIEERRNSSTSSNTNRSEAFIVISDIDSEDSYNSDFNDTDGDLSDSSIDDGMPWAYYGGYGRCYICGRRGHWANGCPNM